MFDSLEELSRKIQLGEDSTLELKAVLFTGEKVHDPHPHSLADELAAFANTRDGVVVLGVDDKTHEVTGIPLNKLDAVELYVRNLCNDLIKPPLPVRILRIELPDLAGNMKPIVRIDVPRSLFVHQSPGGYLYRIGSSRRPMPPEYLARLFQQRSQARLIRFEEQPVPGTSMADLSQALWERFTSPSAEPPETVLLKRSLAVRDETGTVRASVAGVLMCTETPDTYLTGAFIETVRYRGIHQDSNYQIDAQQVRGPLDEQIRQAMRFLIRNQRVAATKDPHRIERPQFSERAVFEGIVNAVAHRDYSIHGSKIRFFIFDDRLEIYSPGALPNTVTIETLPLRQATRNELVTTLLAQCPVGETGADVGRTSFMEKRGDGVPIILRESERLSGRKPEYRLIDESELLLTIYAAPNANQPE